MIAGMHPAEVATLMESLPPAQREVVWNFVEPEVEGDVLVELSEDVRQSFIEGMDAEELLAAAENMEPMRAVGDGIVLLARRVGLGRGDDVLVLPGGVGGPGRDCVHLALNGDRRTSYSEG